MPLNRIRYRAGIANKTLSIWEWWNLLSASPKLHSLRLAVRGPRTEPQQHAQKRTGSRFSSMKVREASSRTEWNLPTGIQKSHAWHPSREISSQKKIIDHPTHAKSAAELKENVFGPKVSFVSQASFVNMHTLGIILRIRSLCPSLD